MKDEDKSKEQLLKELTELRLRNAELEQVEEALRQSQEKLRNILESSPNAITITDLTGEILDCNTATLELHGFNSKEEIVGINAAELITPSEHELVAINTAKTLEKGILKNLEYTMLRMDGSEFFGELNVSVVRSPDGIPLYFIGITTDITARKQAEAQLKTSLQEKDLLLQEIHHRVKNNMTVISSLLNIQASTLEDQRLIDILHDARSRIRTMGMVHERIYHSHNLAGIDFKNFVKEIAHNLLHTFNDRPGKIQVDVHIENISMEIKRAIPCGLIINELLTNAIKYAFPQKNNKKAKITVAMHHNDSREIELIVSDNGCGFPEEIDVSTATSMGLRLVHMMVKQLKGRSDVNRVNGTMFKIRFPYEGPVGSKEPGR